MVSSGSVVSSVVVVVVLVVVEVVVEAVVEVVLVVLVLVLLSEMVEDGNELLRIELVSKELNHFGGIASFFRDWVLGTLTGGE